MSVAADILCPVWAKVKFLVGVTRLRPFAGDTETERSKERYRRIVISSLSAILSKGITVLTALLSVPLTVDYLGPERYGLWMTISAGIAMLAFADFGLGNGLITGLAEAHGRGDATLAKQLVSSAFFFLSGLALCGLALFFCAYNWLPWEKIYNLSTPDAVGEAAPATGWMVLCFALTLPLSIAQKIQIGYQEGYMANLWTAVGAMLAFGGILLAIYLQAGLPWLVLAMSGGPVLGLACNWFVLFHKVHPALRPSRAKFDREVGRRLIGTGLLFLALQVLALIGNASDNLVLAHLLGVSAVAGYAVTQRLFSMTQIAQYFIQPLWPAFAEAVARQDYVWARRTLKRALLVSFILSVCTAVPLCVFGQKILTAWVGPEIVPSTATLLGFGAWVLLAGYGGVMSAFLNREAMLRRQTLFYAVASLTAFGLKIVLGLNWGAAGVIWATVIGYVVFYVVPAGRLAFAEAEGSTAPRA